MSEKIIRFLFKELITIRMVCRNCHTVVETEIKELDKIKTTLHCPGCQTELRIYEYGHLDHFSNLARAYQALTEQDGPVEVEFVIHEKS